MTIPPPGLTAQLDQLAAATTDARHRLTRFGRAQGCPVQYGPLPRWLTPHVRRLAEAITTGTLRQCQHLGPAPAVAQAAVWDPGHLTCPRCADHLTPDPQEDTTCDRCRRHADPIHPGAIAIGPVLLTFGLCPRCLTRTEPTSTRKGSRP